MLFILRHPVVSISHNFRGYHKPYQRMDGRKAEDTIVSIILFQATTEKEHSTFQPFLVLKQLPIKGSGIF